MAKFNLPALFKEVYQESWLRASYATTALLRRLVQIACVSKNANTHTHTHIHTHTHTLSSPRSRKGCLRKRGTRSRRCVHNNTQRHNNTDAESHSPNLIHRISFTELKFECRTRVAEGTHTHTHLRVCADPLLANCF